jgi:aryl-alcohol dehydrogenase-like predicted oxidoreductase
MADMRYRRLGESGLAVSVVGIGCNNFGGRIDDDRAHAVVHAALDAGITLFDTADIYGDPAHNSEEVLGAALGSRRDEAIIATKFGHSRAEAAAWTARGGRGYIQTAVDRSLRRLGTDYIDLYQIHVPDPMTPIAETLDALNDLVRQGKVRYLGHSNFAGWQIADAAWTARTAGQTPFVSAQNEYSLLDRAVEGEVVPACERFGLGLLPYFPLASGLLSGKYHREEAPPPGSRLAVRGGRWLDNARWDTIDALRTYAERRGRSMLDIAIGGLAAKPTVASVIAGATSAEQVQMNAGAISWQPTAEDLAELDALTSPS